ncbi:ACR3 family arsenite efflux transporter [Phenylobacterium deserti]|uniref:Arsenical-resistance protein n=1 Tax=Phenylobacterium deserti TaxID=1914756 RepID=A0A328AD32_9CAUL|nr:ACR3 family arsenite efflux transporter [Phenylobacterium deserti]RAK52672.1 arsenical-resistance protein [Phenylobacterium deserti]
MSRFERFLTLWVALCIVAGVGLGHLFPAVFQAIGSAELAKVNLPVAVLIWLMIIPMLMKVDFGAMRQVGQHWRGIGVTLFVNWAVKPFSMAALGAVFISDLFRPYLPAGEINSYIAGLILLAAAPCTAMVFVWSNLTRGEPHFTLSQVAVNDAIMVVAFAPIVGLLLGLSAITVPWETLLLSVGLYIIAPVVLAQLVRSTLLKRGGEPELQRVLGRIGPLSLTALLATLVLLFGFQGEQILAQPAIIAMLAVPILIQVYANSAIAYLLNRATGEAHCVAGPSALIGASNFFELAVAAAISLFGFSSGAALATVVGVLIEVPVMLTIVAIVNRSKGWYERDAAVQRVAARCAPPITR